MPSQEFLSLLKNPEKKKEQKQIFKRQKRYKPRTNKKNLELMQERDEKLKKFREMISYQDQSQKDKENKQQFYSCFRNFYHSDKIYLNKEKVYTEHKVPQFAVKIVYKNGIRARTLKWMCVAYHYSIKTIEGKQISSYFGENTHTQYVSQCPQVFRLMMENASQGEIGSIFVTPKYGFGIFGQGSQIPPYTALQIDYKIISNRYKQGWEEQQHIKAEWIKEIISEVQEFIDEIKKEKPENRYQKYKQQFYYKLYQIRRSADSLKFAYKRVCNELNQIVFMYEAIISLLFGMKIAAVQLTDKYYQLEKNFQPQQTLFDFNEKCELQILKIRFSLNTELGLWGRLKQDCLFLQNAPQYQKIRQFFQKDIEAGEKILKEWDGLSEEQTLERERKYRDLWNSILEYQQQIEPQQNWIYCPWGYQPYNPKTALPEVVLDKKIPHEDILEWVFGKDLQYYRKQMRKGLIYNKHKKIYEKDYQIFHKQQQKNEKFCLEYNIYQDIEYNIYQDKGFFVQIKSGELWNNFYQRRQKQLLKYRLWRPIRQMGEIETQWKIKIQNFQKNPYQMNKLGKILKKKILRKNNKIVFLPQQKVYERFNIAERPKIIEQQ